VALDERAFFSDRNETRPARYSCPRCNRTNEYSIRWVRRVKKDRLPSGADERDRAKFAKLRDHLIRVDDEVVCKTCGKRFEIPSLHSLLFVDQLEGLPQDVEEEENSDAPVQRQGRDADAAGPLRDQPVSPRPQPGERGRPTDRDRRLPRRMTGPSRGWKG
jgi:hypothetical protein